MTDEATGLESTSQVEKNLTRQVVICSYGMAAKSAQI